MCGSVFDCANEPLLIDTRIPAVLAMGSPFAIRD